MWATRPSTPTPKCVGRSKAAGSQVPPCSMQERSSRLSGDRIPEPPPERGTWWHDEYIDADSVEQIRAAVRRNIYYGATVIKLAADSNVYHFTEEQVRAAVDEAHRAGLTVAVHVYGGEAASNVILGGVDSVEHGYDFTDELLDLMKQKGTYLV